MRPLELFEDQRLLQIVVRGDDAVVIAPGIGIKAYFTTQLCSAVIVNNLKGEGEFILHLLPPLPSQRGWT